MNKGLLALIVGVLAVSTAAVLFKKADAPSLVAGFWRLTFATLILLPFGVRDVARAVRDPKVLRLQVLTGLALAVHFGAWIESLYRTSVAASLVLVTFHPVLVAGFGALVLGEKPGKSGFFEVVVASAGVALLASGSAGSGTAMSGNALAFLGALAMTAYLLAARHARARLSLLAWVVPVYGFCAVFLGIGALLLHQPLTGYAPEQWSYFVVLAAVPMILGHTMFNFALAHLPAWVISTAILGEPIVGTLLASAVLDEVPGTVEVAGGLVTLLGIYLVLRRSQATASVETTAAVQGQG